MPEVGPAVMARAVRGDDHAFATVINHYDHILRSFTCQFIGDPAPMDEVLTEAYVRAYRLLPAYRAETRPSTWLLRIVYHAGLNAMASPDDGGFDQAAGDGGNGGSGGDAVDAGDAGAGDGEGGGGGGEEPGRGSAAEAGARGASDAGGAGGAAAAKVPASSLSGSTRPWPSSRASAGRPCCSSTAWAPTPHRPQTSSESPWRSYATGWPAPGPIYER